MTRNRNNVIAALRVVTAAYEASEHSTNKSKYKDFDLEISEYWHEHGEEVPDGEYNMTVVYAAKKGKQIGYAEFIHKDGGVLLPNNIEIDEDERRQGLATAMYVQAENETGRTIKPHNIQSPEGRELWNQKNRPFG